MQERRYLSQALRVAFYSPQTWSGILGRAGWGIRLLDAPYASLFS